MPQKIALIGVPGSGKTATATCLEEAIIKNDGSCAECLTPISIIDNYAGAVEDAHDYAIGLDGGWLSSIAIAMERYGRERKAQPENKTIITCGTMLESAVYMTMHFEESSRTMDEAALKDAMTRMEAGMRLFASLYIDTFHYSRVFYLPPLSVSDDERVKTLDKNIQAAFNAFNLTPVVPLMFEGSAPEIIAQRVERILNPKEDDETQAQWARDTAS